MKKTYIISLILLFSLSISQVFADSAPSMNMNTNSGNSDAILKMNKVKIVKSADASFFQTLGYTDGYCGLQQSGSTPSIFIFSLWDYNTAANIHAQANYWSPTTASSRFGGEGDGAKTMANYRWQLNTYYNIVIRAWKADGRIYQAAFIEDSSTSKWFHTATLSNIQTDKWLGGNANSFIENWASNGQFARKVFYKDFYTLSPTGNWSKSTGCSVSANSGQADVNRNGIYHNSFNGFYDEEEDAFCMEHGKDVVPGSNFGGGRSANLGLQKRQENMPSLTVGEITSVEASSSEGITTISWEINEYKSPQFSTKIEILNAAGDKVFEQHSTLPELRNISIDQTFESGEYEVILTMTDIFNQTAEVKTTSVTIDSSKYLRVSTNKVTLPVNASENKSFDIASNTNWTITNNADWITLSQASGSNNKTIRLITTDNPHTTKTRTAELLIEGEDTETQTIQVIQQKNETWYILFNQRGWTSGNPIMNNALTGSELGEELTAHQPQAENYYQHWKIEYDKDGRHMQLINRVTGLAIDAECKANMPEDGYLWKLQGPTGNKQFPGYRIISKNGQVGIHAQYTRVFPYNLEVAECFWYIVKPEEIYTYPEDTFEYSAGEKSIWYNIYTPGRADRNYLTDKGIGESIRGEDLEENNSAQLWKIINYEHEGVQLVSKASNGHIQLPPNNRTAMQLGEDAQQWQLVYIGENQYRIQNGELQLNLSTTRIVAGVAGTKLGDSASWIFEKAKGDNTSTNSMRENNIHIFAKDSRIIVQGSSTTPAIYNLAGMKLSANDTLEKGIYIVKVENTIQKIVVQ